MTQFSYFSMFLIDFLQANPFVWMPGSGMSIEITLVNQEKVSTLGNYM